jgi:Tetratricopeptide repeat
MRLGMAAVLIAMIPGGWGSGDGRDSKKPAAPFYRKYLVTGNPLDDQILEQERRVEASPQDANLRNDFGNLLAARRFPTEAAEQYEIALKLDKADFISAYNLGLVRETEGKIGRAIAAYRTAIARKPGFPQAHFRLGRLYEHRGERESAVKEYAKAMLIDPTMREPRRNPLVVDSSLMYQASLVNYERDVAAASRQKDVLFVEESRFRRLPVDRTLSADEVSANAPAGEAEPTPREIGPGNAAGAVSVEAPPHRPPRPAPGEAPGTVPGARTRPGPAGKPRVPSGPPPPSAEPPPGVDNPQPETVPEPTPTPTPVPEQPIEVEPS